VLDPLDQALMQQAHDAQQRIRKEYADLLDVVAEMGRNDTAKHAGYSRLPALLVELLHVVPARARKMVDQAEQITETLTPTGHTTPAPLPTVREAVRSGLIDGEHIDEITTAMKTLPEWTSVADRELVETTLAETAQSANPLVVREHGQILAQRLHADGTEPTDDEPPARVKNSFTYRRTGDGGMDFKGHVERESAELFEKLIHVFGKPEANDTRPRQQRLGDAVCDVIDAAHHAQELPTNGGEKPRIAVYLHWNVLTDAVGTATLESGAALCPHAARRLACDADILPIVLNGDSVPMDLGRSRRVVSTTQRVALIARDKGCAYPDCAAPASWCDAHHVRHWLHGGPTDLSNLVLLCRKHHRILHNSDWHVSINPTSGVPEFRPPKWIDPDQRPRRNTLRQ
jgi:hypothetical protein